MTELEKQLLEALKACIDDSRECLKELKQNCGGDFGHHCIAEQTRLIEKAETAIAAAEAAQPVEGASGERLAAEMALSQQLAARVDDLERQLVAAHQLASAQPAAVPDTPILSDDRLHQLHWDHVGGVESVRTWEYAKHVRLCRAVEREVYAMLSAAPAQVEQQAPDKWQPISTAPKDGTVILGALIGSDVPQSIRYVNGGWHLSWDDYRVAGIDGPSHWQPLPVVPTQGAATRPPAEAKGGEAC
ncbi:hypothetical protein [Chromobacterium haemolyticum]|uniref:DUF551 domain-containing protein n=1 Tax=Chromobacterium haemolyticum TaxID=394935 RepID=A0A1W0D5R7_9NEIS|nr:hypothetical protein [Chromobacterium haemolyticum]OQS42283.1 hypothetical protein B0T45_05680 [Chromobacterium haemolyticum]